MPIGYTVSSEQGVAFVRAWGVLTEADMSALADAMRHDPAIRPDWSTLSDLRDVESIAIGGAFLRGFQSAFTASSRRAVIVSSRESYGLIKMFRLARNVEQLEVFDATDAALEWLGLPPGTKLPDVPGTTFGAGVHL